MIPELFRLGPLPVNSFGLMVALALIAGTLVLGRSFSRRGIETHLAERYVMWGGLSGLLGARLWHMLEHIKETQADPFGMLFANAGFTFYGGFLVAALVLVIRSKVDKIGVLRLADALGPTLALGYAIGRLGCQLSGDGDYGVPTENFWAMSYALGAVPTPPGVRVFVTPFMESAASVAIAVFLSRFEEVKRLRDRPGSLFGLYLILISLERFFVEFLRHNPNLWAGFSQAQCVSLALVLIGGAMFALSRPIKEVQPA